MRSSLTLLIGLTLVGCTTSLPEDTSVPLDNTVSSSSSESSVSSMASSTSSDISVRPFGTQPFSVDSYATLEHPLGFRLVYPEGWYVDTNQLSDADNLETALTGKPHQYFTITSYPNEQAVASMQRGDVHKIEILLQKTTSLEHFLQSYDDETLVVTDYTITPTAHGSIARVQFVTTNSSMYGPGFEMENFYAYDEKTGIVATFMGYTFGVVMNNPELLQKMAESFVITF